MSELLAAGIDVGSSAVKVAIARSSATSDELVALHAERIRRRELRKVITESSRFSTA